jgi:hypothetical protein
MIGGYLGLMLSVGMGAGSAPVQVGDGGEGLVLELGAEGCEGCVDFLEFGFDLGHEGRFCEFGFFGGFGALFDEPIAVLL